MKLVITQDILDNNKRMFVYDYDTFSIKEVSVDKVKEMLDDEWEIIEQERINNDYEGHGYKMRQFFVDNNVTKMYHAETPNYGVLDLYIVE